MSSTLVIATIAAVLLHAPTPLTVVVMAATVISLSYDSAQLFRKARA